MKEKNLMWLISCIVGNIIVLISGVRLNMEVIFFIFPICFVIGISFLTSRIIFDEKKKECKK